MSRTLPLVASSEVVPWPRVSLSASREAPFARFLAKGLTGLQTCPAGWLSGAGPETVVENKITSWNARRKLDLINMTQKARLRSTPYTSQNPPLEMKGFLRSRIRGWASFGAILGFDVSIIEPYPVRLQNMFDL